jgi:hypothetical protein
LPADRRPVVRAPEEAWRRLGERLQLRRGELGYRRRPAFTREHDINIRLVADIENAHRPNTFLTPTLRDIAQAYQVTYDSIVAVLAGAAAELTPAEPVPLPVPSAPGSDSRRSSTVTGEDKNTATWPYAEAIWQRLHELASAGNPDPAGADLFGEGTDDARAWDDLRLRQLLPLRERVRNIADLRRREAATSPVHSA